MSTAPTGAAPSTSAGEGVNTGAPATGQATQPAPTGATPSATTERTFTQTDVDRLIKERLTEEKRRAEKAQRDAELPELAKRDARIAELESALSGHERRAREYALKDAIAETVADERFPYQLRATTARAAQLLDAGAIDWDGAAPKNVGRLLQDLARTDAYLFEPKPRRPGSLDGGQLPAAAASDMNQMLRRAAGRG